MAGIPGAVDIRNAHCAKLYIERGLQWGKFELAAKIWKILPKISYCDQSVILCKVCSLSIQHAWCV